MGKPANWIAIGVASLILVPPISFFGYRHYHYYLFPKFPIGSCAEDQQVHRVYQITAVGDTLIDGPGDAVVILKVGVSVPGVYSVGQKVFVSPDDPNLVRVECPSIRTPEVGTS